MNILATLARRLFAPNALQKAVKPNSININNCASMLDRASLKKSNAEYDSLKAAVYACRSLEVTSLVYSCARDIRQ